MPTFNDPNADAREAREALRGLAHATRHVEDPGDLHGLVGQLRDTARALHSSLWHLSHACVAHQERATSGDGDQQLGSADAWAASDVLLFASQLATQAEASLNQAAGHLERIDWQPDPDVERRWVKLAQIRGPLADEVIQAQRIAGTSAVIERLQPYDWGPPSDQDAIRNGDLYDAPQVESPDDERLDLGIYTLVMNDRAHTVSFYRIYRPPQGPPVRPEGGAAVAGAGPAAAVRAEPAKPALETRRDRVRGVGAWFEHPGIAAVKRARGLER